MASTIEVLKRARSLLEEKGWTQGEMARDKDGYPIFYGSPGAVCFCTVGALDMAARDMGVLPTANPALCHMRSLLNDSLMWWNDQPERTELEVLMTFDFAILVAEEG